LTAEGLLLLMFIIGVFAAMNPTAPTKPDRLGLAQYLLLIATLSAMCMLPVPMDGAP
jgi:hypothetical protein